MTTIMGLLFAAFLAACSAPTDDGAESDAAAIAPIEGSLFAAAPARQWRLPPELREISGMATTEDGRLFAHDDEHAIVYEIDPAAGRIMKRFGVGGPEQGDFEGLAIGADGVFWLATSTGQLLRFREGDNEARVPFERFETGLEGVCEVEGLAFLTASESLILACKRIEGRAMRGSIVLYQWRPGAGAQVWRTIAEAEITQVAGVDRFRPSSVEIDRRTGRTLILSASDAALAELDADGALLSARALRGDHPQAEGLAILPNGALVIADEGAGARALLSVYDPAQ